MKLIFTLLILFGSIFSQVTNYVLTAEERIIKSGTEAYWRASSVWILEGDLIIEKGASLTIAPGTTIKFRPNTDVTRTGKIKNKAEVIVLGDLVAKGEPSLNKFITFTSDAEPGQERSNDWYGIVIYKNAAGANTQIRNVNIQYAYRGISCIGSSPYILKNRILYNDNSGIYLSKSNAIIESNIIQSNYFAGIEVRINSNPKIYENIIKENDYGIMIYDSSEPSLGNTRNNKGENVISDNYKYDIYNASSKNIMAIKNSWGDISNTDSIKKKIFDNSNVSKYGKVTFLPISKLTFAELQQQNIQEQIAPAIASVSGASSGRTNQPVKRNTTPTNNTPKKQTTSKPVNSNQQKVDNAKKEEVKTATQPPSQTKPTQEELQKQQQEEEPVVDEGPDYYQQSLNTPFLKYALDPTTGQIIQKAKPDYSGSIAELNIRGRVIFKLTIDIEGNVKSAQILRSDNKLLEETATEAAKKYKFTPGKIQNQLVEFEVTEIFTF